MNNVNKKSTITEAVDVMVGLLNTVGNSAYASDVVLTVLIHYATRVAKEEGLSKAEFIKKISKLADTVFKEKV